MPEPYKFQKQQSEDKTNSLPQIYKMLLGGMNNKSFKDMNQDTYEQSATVNQDQMHNPAHAKLSQVTPKNVSDMIRHDCIA